MKFNFYQDPGHGWVKVPKTLVQKLGIFNDISTFSYERKDFLYLEEDSDLALFIKAMKGIGKSVTFREFHTNRQSKIRSYKVLTTP